VDVIEAGAAGDRFYIVGEGELVVMPVGGEPRAAGPGDYFGEIALLRDVPRTATVRAETELRLYALGRDEFIGAVTGHPPSHDAADTVIGERLGALRTGTMPA
jgi:CRP-like cAMP-binding protein